ncbi:hypothetical protein IMAU60057_02800 [Lactiplantibacillus plantarum]|nr:hypothetical protein [Lactiplantibacillus plantarum]
MSIHRGLPVLVILAVCGGLLTLPATNAQALRVFGEPVSQCESSTGRSRRSTTTRNGQPAHTTPGIIINLLQI